MPTPAPSEHITVLLHEAVEALVTTPEGLSLSIFRPTGAMKLLKPGSLLRPQVLRVPTPARDC